MLTLSLKDNKIRKTHKINNSTANTNSRAKAFILLCFIKLVRGMK